MCYWITVTRANFIMKRKKKADDHAKLLDEEMESMTEANATTLPTSASYINEGFKEEDQESSFSETAVKIESTTSEKQKVYLYCKSSVAISTIRLSSLEKCSQYIFFSY